jgi:hypothetical protein
MLRKQAGLTKAKKENIQEECMNKKIVLNVGVLVLLTLAALDSGYAQSHAAPCNNKLIAGAYGFTVQGTKLAGPGPIGPQVGVAMAQFDGKGSFTQIDTVTINGEVVSDFTHTPAMGTYTVNSDCTGTFTIHFTDGRPPVDTSFVVVGDGSEIDTVVTSAGGSPGILATGSVGKRRFSKH